MLNDQLVQAELLCRTFKHTLLNAAFSDEAEDVDLFGLANTMGTIHCLQVSLRVPVAVVEHHDIGGGQVDTKTSGTGREKENELLAPWLVILVDSHDTIVVCGTAVNATVL